MGNVKKYRKRLTNHTLGDIMNDLTEMPLDGSRWVEVKDGRSRSEAQNRLAFLWYAYISGQIDGQDKAYTRSLCKLQFGVPILCESSEEFSALWDSQAAKHDYEEQIVLMDYMPVTSMFTVKEFTEYLQAMERAYAERGIILPTSDDAYYQALGYRRVGTRRLEVI